MSPSTAARRRELRRLVEQQAVERQTEMVEMLTEAGYPVTQATVSRDLAAIGAVKERVNGRTRYAIPPPGAGSEERAALARVLAEFVEAITPAGNLVVVKTPPGAAQMVAGAIDHAGLATVVGTVAGDDTVLAVTPRQDGGPQLAEELEQIGAGR